MLTKMAEECTPAVTSPFINGQPNSNALRELVYCTLTLTPSHTSHSHTHTPSQVYWSDSGELVFLAADDSYFILRYQADAVQQAVATNEGMDDDGVEAAFDVRGGRG